MIWQGSSGHLFSFNGEKSIDFSGMTIARSLDRIDETIAGDLAVECWRFGHFHGKGHRIVENKLLDFSGMTIAGSID
jgi:hypothetical protein